MIRVAIVTDAPKIATIEQEVFDNPYSIEIILKDISKGKTLVYERDNCIVGYAVVSNVLDEGEIERIATKPEYLRQGIGGELLHFAINHLRSKGVTKYYLEVKESNQPAIKLYQKYGFVVNGSRKGYYHDGATALLMSRML